MLSWIKQSLLALCALTLALSHAAYAGLSSGPRAALPIKCHISLTYPAALELEAEGECDSQGNLTGAYSGLRAHPIGAPADTFLIISSTFIGGIPSGATELFIPTAPAITFVGTMYPGGRVIGTTTYSDGSVDEGESRNGRMWSGKVTRPLSMGGGTTYFRNGQRVSANTLAQRTRSSDPAATVSRVQVSKLPPRQAPIAPTDARVCTTPTLVRDRQQLRRAYCQGRMAQGQLVFVAIAPNTTTTYTGNFVSGRIVGPASFTQAEQAYTFTGTLEGWLRSDGTSVFENGVTEKGHYVSGQLYQGTITKSAPHGELITLTVEGGQQVGRTEGEQLAAISERYQPKHIVHMTRVRTDGGTCLADLPTAIYKISAELDGRCRDGAYSGRATLTLSPLPHSALPRARIELTYVAGEISGPAQLTYTQRHQKFTGTLSNWLPSDGTLETALGNRRYEVAEWQGGTEASVREEYRAPSEMEVILTNAAVHLATNLANCSPSAPMAQV